MTESNWDDQLGIMTVGRDGSHSDEYHFPYEPTPYRVLERLADSSYLSEDNVAVDYGCGKGRVSLYLNWKIGCRTVGVEFDGTLYSQAKENQNRYGQIDGVEFLCVSAEEYAVKDADRFYFFNPFSEEILKTVLGRIMDSYYDEPREMLLFFYYPSDEYVGYLMTADELMFVDEIDCRDLFSGSDERERILIFEVVG